MRWLRDWNSSYGGAAPATPGFTAVRPECFADFGAAKTAPAVPAPESTLGSHPCVALSSAQVLPEWFTVTQPRNALAPNGDYPLNFVSHSRGSLHVSLPGCRRLFRSLCAHLHFLSQPPARPASIRTLCGAARSGAGWVFTIYIGCCHLGTELNSLEEKLVPP